MDRKKLALGAVGLLGGGILGVLVSIPTTYQVERSVYIDAPPPVVFPFVADLSNHDQWSPWKADDPSIQITLGEQRAGVGATYSWTSDDGPGKSTVRAVQANRLVAYDLDLGDRGQAIGYWQLRGSGLHKTRLTWGIMGDANGFFARLMVPMMGRFIGPSFERGLQNLKAVAEAAESVDPDVTSPEAPEATQ